MPSSWNAPAKLSLHDPPAGPTPAAIARVEGVPRAQARILAEVNRVAMMASCTVASEVLAEIAILIYRNWGNRSLGDLRLALEMGMSEGPFYGKITYPIIAEWIAAFFRRAEDVAYDRHLSTK